MQAMSNADVSAGATETQQMRILAPAGVSQSVLRGKMTGLMTGANTAENADFFY
jgi:AP-1 complex subunit gamma-1